MSVKKRKGLLLYDGVWYSRIFEDGRFAVPQSLLPDGVTPKFYRAFVPFDDKRGEIRFERIKNLPLKENMKNNKKIYNNRFVNHTATGIDTVVITGNDYQFYNNVFINSYQSTLYAGTGNIYDSIGNTINIYY